MAMYFFNIRDAHGVMLDEEGSQCASAMEAFHEAEISARDIARHFVEGKKTLSNVFVDIEDAERVIIASLSITQMVQSPGAPRFFPAHRADFTADPSLQEAERMHRRRMSDIAAERAVLDSREAAEELHWLAMQAQIESQRD
jgi:hypothetical protein